MSPGLPSDSDNHDDDIIVLTDDDDLILLSDDDDDLLVLSEPPAVASTPTPDQDTSVQPTPWTVLVVDDEPAVHTVTDLALSGFLVEGCPLRILHATSGREAREVLSQEPTCAMVLLDVVMESDEEGLSVARWIRETLQNPLVRIVIRTGQPGQAPETDVVTHHDIHGYHSKTDLTVQKLRTTVTGAVRSWRDLRTIEQQRSALERVIEATGNLFEPDSITDLLQAILKQIGALLYPRNHALFFVGPAPLFNPESEEPVVLAASGRFADRVKTPVRSILREEQLGLLQGISTAGRWEPIGDDGVFGFDLGQGARASLYLEQAFELSEWDRQTLALYCSSAAMALRNQRLFEEREELLSAFRRFVPTPFLTLLDHTDVRQLSVGDQAVRELAVCFFDVEGFTRRAEALGADQVFSLLNRIYAAVGPVLSQHGGVIDKYMGDGIMVLFPEGAAAALDAAEAVQTTLEALNTAPDLREDPIVMRSTLEQGRVILGTVGHENRFDTTVIADAVNVASRLQGWSRTLGVPVLATEACQSAAPRPYRRALGSHALRGRQQPVALFEHFAAHPLREAREAARPHFEHGVSLREAGDLLGAIGAFRSSLAAHPEDPAARWLLHDAAAALQKTGN